MPFPRILPAVVACAVTLPLLAADFPAPERLPANSVLPDPLTMLDGTRITTAAEWRERRAPELRALFQHYMYGVQPATVPVSGKLLREDTAAFGGKATLREVLVDIGQEEPIQLLIVFPNARPKPCAVFLGLNFSGNYAVVADPLVQMPGGWVSEKFGGTPANRASETGRGKQAEMWSIEQTIDRGYAVATFHNSNVVPDQPQLAREKLKDLLPPGVEAGAPDAPATIMAWAWAFSRMVDYLATVPEVDAKRVAVVGHSRNGKAALLAGAMDERIALVIPSQAGCGGSAPDRVAPELAALQANGRPKVETVAVITKNFPHWFAGNFTAFGDAPEKLPFDQHALIALCAPRPVLISCAEDDAWSNPSGQFAMLAAAAPVYRLMVDEAVGAAEMPPSGKLLAARLGYFIRPGRHSMNREDWSAWLDYADKWLR